MILEITNFFFYRRKKYGNPQTVPDRRKKTLTAHEHFLSGCNSYRSCPGNQGAWKCFFKYRFAKSNSHTRVCLPLHVFIVKRKKETVMNKLTKKNTRTWSTLLRLTKPAPKHQRQYLRKTICCMGHQLNTDLQLKLGQKLPGIGFL